MPCPAKPAPFSPPHEKGALLQRRAPRPVRASAHPVNPRGELPAPVAATTATATAAPATTIAATATAAAAITTTAATATVATAAAATTIPATTSRAARRSEAVVAVDRAVTTWFERDPRLAPAGRTGCGEHLAGRPAVPAARFALAGRAAVRATARFIREPLRSMEFLLPGGECEFSATIGADQGFVGVRHSTTSKHF